MLGKVLKIGIAVVIIIAVAGIVTPSYASRLGAVRNWIERKMDDASSDETLAENAREGHKEELEDFVKNWARQKEVEYKAEGLSNEISKLNNKITTKETSASIGVHLLKTHDPNDRIRFPNGKTYTYPEVNRDVVFRFDELTALNKIKNNLEGQKGKIDANIRSAKNSLAFRRHALEMDKMDILFWESRIATARIQNDACHLNESSSQFSIDNDSRCKSALRRRAFEVEAENEVRAITSGELVSVSDVPLETLVPERSGIEASEQYYAEKSSN